MPKFYNKTRQKASCLLIFVLVVFSAQPAWAKVSGDPYYVLQQQSYNQIGAPQAWNITVGLSNVMVAIIDTGVDIANSDLKNNIWTNLKEISNNGIDDDKNGYVDDVNGWNFVNNNNDVTPHVSAGGDYAAITHGTILAGIVGAAGGNNIDGVGLNWNVRIMPVKAVDGSGSGTLVNIARAIDYAVKNGANVIILSFVGDTSSPGLDVSLRNAYGHGAVIVTAAGNNREDGVDNGNLDKNIRYPSCSDRNNAENWILGVASVDAADQLSLFSNYGSCIDLTAPGERIFSTQVYYPATGNNTFGGPWYGSSFSTAYVAGAAALVKSVRPDWQAKEIISILTKTADDISVSNTQFTGQIGFGRLNVGRAVQAALVAVDTPEEKIGKLYYFEGNQIFQYNVADSREQMIAKTGDGRVENLVVGDVNGDSENELVALVARGAHEYVRVMNFAGGLINEFSLKADKNIQKRSINLSFTNGQSFVIVNNIYKKNAGSEYFKYDMNGIKISSLKTKTPAVWSVFGADGLVFADLVKNKMQITIKNWSGKNLYQFGLPGVSSVADLQVGRLWNPRVTTAAPQIAATLVRNGESREFILDFVSNSWLDHVLDYGAKNKLNLTIGYKNDAILVYNIKTGIGEITDTKGNMLKNISLPSLPAGQIFSFVLQP